MLYQIKNGTLSFGDKVVLSHVDLEIRGKEKIGIVGANGSGKTSLLKLITGELELDRDDKRQGKGILFSRQLKIEVMTQDNSRWQDRTVEEIMLDAFFRKEGIQEERPAADFQAETKEDGGAAGRMDSGTLAMRYSAERFYYEQRYDRMLQSFGFSLEVKSKRLKEFSGGEQTKIMLVKLLLTEADLLLMDEPTNHLDGESVEALEQYLKEYTGAVAVVSHDRYFLDQVAEVIYELEDAKLTRYTGNYSAYRKEKRSRMEKQKKAYERQQEEITRNEQLIASFKNKPRKAAFARSRRSMLDRMTRIEKPKDSMGHIFTGELTPEYPGPKWMLRMEKLSIGFENESPLIRELDLPIRRGQKIGIIGRNGIGKSTLLKTLAGLVLPLKGSFRFGEKVTVGYFDQSTGQMDSTEKVAEYFHRLFPGLPEKELYGRLAAFLFSGSMCQHLIATLSGGEKTRLKLCELMTLCPNFLILDEPTNHCDIPTKETLESAFQAYQGTMLIVSHDRYFLNQVADAILVLEGDQAFYYPFGYSHYVQSRRRMTELADKGISLDELPGMLSTQEQAMVAALKAVPKESRMQAKQLSDEEAYLEWKLRLAGEPMEEAKEMVEALTEEAEKLEEFLGQKELELLETEERQEGETTEAAQIRADLAACQERLEVALQQLTEACLSWYDILNEGDTV